MQQLGLRRAHVLSLVAGLVLLVLPRPAQANHDGSTVPRKVNFPTNISTPVNLHVPASVAECKLHDALGCDYVGDATRLVMVWDGRPDATGYRVYRVDGGRHLFIGPHSVLKINGAVMTMLSLTHAKAGDCFAVTWTTGGVESGLSPQFCTGGTAGTVSLAPVHVRTYEHYKNAGGGPGCPFFGPDENGTVNDFIVGFRHDTKRCGVGSDESEDRVFRGALFFDFSRFNGKTIEQATLQVPVDETYVSASHYQGAGDFRNLTCAVKMAPGIGSWWNGKGPLLIHEAQLIGLPSNQSSVDITSVAAAWAQPATEGHLANTGLVFLGGDESLSVFGENACQTNYRMKDVRLAVTYR